MPAIMIVKVIQLLFSVFALTMMCSANEINFLLIIDTILPYHMSQKPIICANYSFPGPLIEAFEGDIVAIRVINLLSVPSTIHWHGMDQIGTPDMDGVAGITQCAIPPKSEMTYRFQAEPAGATWYHGHYMEQYIEGLYGPLIIHPLNRSNQHHDNSEHILMVSDWYNNRAHDELLPWYLNPQNPNGNEPIPDAIVVNGNFTQSLVISLAGALSSRFCIINAASFSMFKFSIDGLPLHITELDQMETSPYTVDSFTINVGQRVSFHIQLKELASVYRMSGKSSTNAIFIRFEAIASMYPVDIGSYIPVYEPQRYPYPTFFHPIYLATLLFSSNNDGPTYAANQPVPKLEGIAAPSDTNLLASRPLNKIANRIPNATHYLNLIIAFNTDANGINRGYLNNVTYSSDANNMHIRADPAHGITSDKYTPILQQMATNADQLNIQSSQKTASKQLVNLQSDGNGHYFVPFGAVVDLYLNNTDKGEHPFHLHGHHFWIIATSDNAQAEKLYFGNYIRRDVVSVPPSGWAKIRFIANNPGAWFFHCHMEWHMAAGLALTFIVAPEQLLANGYTISKTQEDLCQALKDFDKKNDTAY